MDQGTSERHVRQINYHNWLNYVESGDDENVEFAINVGICDVNKGICHYGEFKSPLLNSN